MMGFEPTTFCVTTEIAETTPRDTSTRQVRIDALGSQREARFVAAILVAAFDPGADLSTLDGL